MGRQNPISLGAGMILAGAAVCPSAEAGIDAGAQAGLRFGIPGCPASTGILLQRSLVRGVATGWGAPTGRSQPRDGLRLARALPASRGLPGPRLVSSRQFPCSPGSYGIGAGFIPPTFPYLFLCSPGARP